MTTSKSIALHRQERDTCQDVIAEFRYRQALTLTLFEARCHQVSSEERRFLVSEFENNADEMEHHGYYSHYHNRLLYTLTHKALSYQGFRRHLALKPEQAEAVMISYHLSTPSERDRFKRHLIAGAVEQRPEIRTQKPCVRPFEKSSVHALGDTIILKYQYQLHRPSDLNVFSHLSHCSIQDRKTIHSLADSAIQTEKEKGITIATKQLTDDLVPYYFKEAKPFIASAQKNKSEIANYAAFYARRDKFFRIQSLVSSFAWTFLTLNTYDQRRSLEYLYPEKQRKITQRLKKIHCDDYCY